MSPYIGTRKYRAKVRRMQKHIEDSLVKEGYSREEAKRRSFATLSSRGYPTHNVGFRSLKRQETERKKVERM